MRGGYLHNEAIGARLKQTLEDLGARVATEHPVGPGRRAGAVDLYAELGGLRLVCEIELTPRRVLRDLRKAETLGVDLLLIVTPTAAEARTIRDRLRTYSRSRVHVRVLPMGLAIKHLSQLSEVDSRRDKRSRIGLGTRGGGR